MPRAGKVIKVHRWTTEMVQQNEHWIVLFGDNLRGIGTAGQAIIRSLPNAYGIPTKKEPSMDDSSFFSDDDYEENVMHIIEAFQALPTERLKTGELTLVLPEDGLGTGLAQLSTRAPRTKQFLDTYLAGYVATLCGL